MAHQQDTEEIAKGVLWIYRRTDQQGGNWQARIKLPGDKRYIRVSLKTPDRTEAIFRAEDSMHYYKNRLREGKPVWTKLFGDVAKSFLTHMTNEQKAGRIKEGRLKFVEGTTRRYLVPYFGNFPIPDITEKDIREYRDWRRQQGRKPPKDNSLRFEESVLRQTFHHATLISVLEPKHIPNIDSPQAGSDKRPGFGEQEWKQLARFLEKWPNQTKHPRVKRDRLLLRDYINIMRNSGMRPGEARGLCWRHLGYITNENGDKQLKLTVTGKRGAGDLVPLFGTDKFFDRIKKYSDHTKRDDYVFCHTDGSLVKTFERSFEAALKAADLLNDSLGQKRTIYSLRHTYATHVLQNGFVDVYMLAKNMRTSVSMIEKHYGQVQVVRSAAKLGGATKKKSNAEKK